MNGVYEAGISVTFHATHSLKGNFGPACEVHPHDYRVDLTIIGEGLTDEGILIDIVRLQQAIDVVTGPWEGRCLDMLPELHGINTTVETLARYLHDRVSVALGDSHNLALDVKVWESPSVWGAYRARIAADS